jgi:dihydrofolate synthase/folylpolyglutamate synthase
MQGLLRFGEKYGNQRFEELLRRLGNPHRQFPALHIAGTKGKGSTTTFAASILRSAGYRTGSYLSPFVYDLLERIQIDGKMIATKDFARWVSLIKTHIDTIMTDTELGQITEFELKTAVAFCYFAEQKVDYAIVEVGIGGRLDATNVIPPPVVAVITNIGFDHVEILGDSLELIAAEKAGIIKTGTVCVTGINGGPALTRVAEICEERLVALNQVVAGRDWATSPDHSLSVQTNKRHLNGIHLSMRGQFQHANAALALHAIDDSAIPTIGDAAVRTGLETAFAPGRLEVVREAGPTIILDAAHNELAARVLVDSLIKDFRADQRPLYLVVGMSHRHEPAELLKELFAKLHPKLFIATEPSFRPRPAADLVAEAQRMGIDCSEMVKSVPEAARRALRASREVQDAWLLVTGSFYTIGDLPPAMWRSEVLTELS